MTAALELAQAALAAADGDEAEVVVQSESSALARFAASEVHQPTLIDNDVVRLRLVRDGKVGGASTNRTSEEGFRDLARRAAEAVESAPSDPDFPGLAPPEAPATVDGYDERTAALGPDEQAQLAAAAIDAGRPFALYGYVTSGVTQLAVASTAGVAVEHRLTDAAVLALAADDGASGYAQQLAWSVDAIDPAQAAREAAEKAAATRGAATLEPGVYRAVLEPEALADLLEYFGSDSFGGLGLLQESGYFAGRVGERVFDPKVTIVDDALEPAGLPRNFDFEGVPKRRVELVSEGVARGVVWDRATAARAGGGQESTGHALPSELAHWGPVPLALTMAGGDAESVEELAELVGDGIYVTRLHYLSIVSPREGIVTGMTRDGTFRVRNGRLAEPLVNLRFTASVPELLAEVPGLSRERKLVNLTEYYDERLPYGALVPAIATARFAVTGAGSEPGL